MNIWFQKKGGSDNYEIWCVKQLGDAENKFKIAFSSLQPFMEEISIKYFANFII